jgi:hypothetical protein
MTEYSIDRWHTIDVYDINDDKHILSYGTVAIPRKGECLTWENDEGYHLFTTVAEVHHLVGDSRTIFTKIRLLVEVDSVL